MILSFWLLLICVVGTANGPVGMVMYYEKDVQDRVVELGLTTREKIKKTSMIANLFDRLFVDEWWVGHTRYLQQYCRV